MSQALALSDMTTTPDVADFIGHDFATSIEKGVGVGGWSCWDLCRQVYRRMGMHLPVEAELGRDQVGNIRSGGMVFEDLGKDAAPRGGDMIAEYFTEPGEFGYRWHVSIALDQFDLIESVPGTGVCKGKIAPRRKLGTIRHVLRPVGKVTPSALADSGTSPGGTVGGEITPIDITGMGETTTWVMIALAVASAIGTALLSPRISTAITSGSDAEQTRYGFNKYSRDAVAGEAIPVVLGEHDNYGGVNIGANPSVEDDQGQSRMRILICYGPGGAAGLESIGGQTADFDALDASSMTGIKINDQPASTFRGVKFWGRMGTAGQPPIPGFDDTEIPREVGTGGVTLRNTSGVDRTGAAVSGEVYNITTIASAGVDAVVLRVRFPNGLYSVSGASAQLGIMNASIRVRTRVHDTGGGSPGSWSAWTQWTVSRAERSELFSTKRLDNLGTPGSPTTYDVQVERVSVEPADATAIDTMLFDTFVEINYASNNYDGYALLAIEITASEQINASAPRITAAVKGIKCRVWDGVDASSPSFTRAWSNNPADLELELRTNTQFGMGATYADENIHFPSLLEWRTSCAEEIARLEGGGTRPRYACNWIMDKRMNGVDASRTICATGRCTPVMAGLRWAYVEDKPQSSPVEKFTARSVAAEDGGGGAGGKAKFEYTRKFTLEGLAVANRRVIQFKNERDNGNSDAVGWPELGTLWLATETLREESESMDGVTDPEQALAEAEYRCKRDRFRERAGRHVTTRPLVKVQPGERFDMAFPMTGWGSASGGLRPGCTTTTLLLDETLEIEDGYSYVAEIVHQDGTFESAAVDMPVGSHAPGTTIALGATLAQAPAAYAEYAIGRDGIVMKPCLCQSVAIIDTENLTWEIKWVEYVESVYEAGSTAAGLPTYSVLSGNTVAPGPLTDIRATERTVGGMARIELAWSQLPIDKQRTASYRIYYRVVGTSTWQLFPSPSITSGGAVLSLTEDDRAYEFCAIAVSLAGAAISQYDPRVLIAVLVFGLAAEPPPPPTGLTITCVGGNTYELTWDAMDGATSYQVLAGGEVTGMPNTGAEDCFTVARPETNSLGGLELPPGESCTFWVRSVNSSGRASFTASRVTEATPVTPPGKAIKDTHTFDFTTEGTFTNCSWTSGRVRVTSAGTPGVWLSPWIDLTTVTMSELTFRPQTINDATDPTISTDPFTAPSIAADQWGVISTGPAVVGMIFPPWPDSEQTWLWEVRTNNGVVDSDWMTLAAFASIERTFQKYQVRVTLSRRHAPYRAALGGLTVVVTD